jgi:hypothetical protein
MGRPGYPRRPIGHRLTHGPQCSVCACEHRAAVEVGLVLATPVRILARRYGLSKDACFRHGRRHVSPQIRAAILANRPASEIDLARLQVTESEGILTQLVMQRARLQAAVEQALEVGNTADVCREQRITANLELVAKLLGQLVQHHTVEHRNVLVTESYLRLRSTLIEALRPFPEAARAVGAALHRLESEAAADIRARAANGKVPLVIEHNAGEAA